MKQNTKRKLNIAGAGLLDLTMISPMLRLCGMVFGIKHTSVREMKTFIEEEDGVKYRRSYSEGADLVRNELENMNENEISEINRVTIFPQHLKRFVGLPYGLKETKVNIYRDNL